MRLCKKIIVVVIAAQLAACGGGDGAIGTTASTSGKAADGYLVDAKACLDSNLNKQCDANEPSAMTGSSGEFTIQAEQSAIDTAPILIEAIAGKTVDLDDPNNTISDNYTLSAPAKSIFVSPISTLVQNEIELGSSQQEAVESISEKLGSTIDIAADYVKLSAEDSADSPEYERLHKTAQVLVDIQVKKAKELQTASGAAHSDKMAVINSDLEKQLDQIVGKVDAAGDSFDPATVADDVLPNMDITPENLQDKVDAIESEKTAVSLDMLALLKSDSIYRFTSQKETLYRESLGLKNDITDSSKIDLISSVDEWADGFIPITRDQRLYVLIDSGWQLANDTVVALQISNGEEVLETDTLKRSVSVSVKKMDISYHSIKSVVGEEAEGWQALLNSQAKFAPETFAYQLKKTPLDPLVFTFYDGEWCQGSEVHIGGICNSVGVGTGDGIGYADSLESVTKSSADMQQQGLVTIGQKDNKPIMAEMLISGEIYFYEIQGDAELMRLDGTGKWIDKVIHNQTIREIFVPTNIVRNLDWNSVDIKGNTSYLSEYKGFLRVVGIQSDQTSESTWFDENSLIQIEQAIVSIP
ncbi:Acid phosphatase [Vibrio scophthalmi]|nr:Acid phosphatase [Vibrio scophthalmi]